MQLSLLAVASTASLFGRSSVGPLQETMRVALGLSDTQMAILQGPALALPMVLAGIPIGMLIDRYSRARLLLILTALAIVGSVLTALATNFTLLFAARCLVGLTVTGTGTAAFSLLADLYRPAERGRSSMAVVIGQYVGTAAAFALGGALVVLGTSSSSWRHAQMWMTLPLGVALLALLGLHEPLRKDRRLDSPSIRQTCAELWQYRGEIGPLLAALTLLQMAMQPVLVWAAPTLARGFDLAPDRVGRIMAIGVITSGIVGSIAGGFLADLTQAHGGSRQTMGMLCLLSLLCIPLMLFAVVPTLVLASTLLALFLAVVCALEVAGTALFTVVIPNELRGVCVALLAAGVMIFGVGVSPVVVSLVSSALGGAALIGRSLAIVGAAVGVVGAATFALGRRRLSDDANASSAILTIP